MSDHELVMDSGMLDLETMGTGPNAAVVQIVFIPFNLKTGKAHPDFFEVNVDLLSSIQAGGEVDVDQATVKWWQNQDGFYPTGESVSISEAIRRLNNFIGGYPELKRVWAQGASFDIAIMEGFARRVGAPAPWKYNAGRDTRTVYDLARETGWDKPEGTAPTYRAWEVCRQQIICLMSALNHLRGNKDAPAEYQEIQLPQAVEECEAK